MNQTEIREGFLNPLSSDGQRILHENIDLNSIFDENEKLIEIINRVGHGIMDDDSKIPKSLGELAIKRIEWYFREKNDKKFKINEYSYFFNEDIYENDVVCFHLLAQAIAQQYNTNSREARLFFESQKRIIEERLNRMNTEFRNYIVDNTLDELLNNITTLKWTDLINLISSKKISLEDLLLSGGEIILNEDDFRETFYTEIEDWQERRIESVYNELVGYKVKELILTQIIVQNTEEYLKNIKEKLAIIDIHPKIKKLSEELEKQLKKLTEKYSEFYGSGSGFSNEFDKAEKLMKEAFPPCVLKTIEGVKSGNRNDAIVLFLTSFISYSRLYPQVFKNNENISISDVDPNLDITFNEILPIINEAAENAVPPLFEDQPQEKINIVSKLGFGMHSEPKLENEGETKWYTPMSCEKIKIHLGNLCHPNKACKKIGNPLSYYSMRKWQLKKDGKLNNTSKDSSKKKDKKNK
ncbi:DNA primase [Methanobrevibacter filiformis]|uniref:DNA primase large subunit PriL n=1 Tax=Methanobrevibacter filiformis TaxID=55758 RepID=A0A166CKV3_9EURY|nr:DNA primase [Methanobrevibacter filiformis]KZX15127.1 DNA primase large subunit [Methanobrevibacter filiformis]